MRSWIRQAAGLLLVAGAANVAWAQDGQNARERVFSWQAQVQPPAIPPTPQAPRALVVRANPPAKKEKAAFLGVVTTPVNAAMRQQLQLKKGVGLVVERVEKDSPAEAAGIQQYDVLEKLGDQWLVNTQQLSVLVRLHNPGDDVAVSLIRQGQPKTVTAKLVEKELAVLPESNPWGMAGGNVFGDTFVAPEGAAVFSGPMHVDIDNLLQNMDNKQSMTMSMNDDEHTLTLTVREGKKHLTATDRSGNVVFNGPIDTDEQRKALPPELAGKVEKLEVKPNMIRMRVNRSSTTAPSDLP